MLSLADVHAARARLAGTLQPSPLETSERLSKMLGGTVALKLENRHRTGSFKERGALNRLLTLSPEARTRGVVAGSAGNHAQAVAYHAVRLGMRCTIVMPVGTPLVKVTATREHGAHVVLYGSGYDEAFAEAERCASTEGLTLVHGFDDEMVMAGTGTIGLELVDTLADLACVVVPIGGGGLIGGIAVAIKESRPHVRVVGVQSARVPSMLAALATGAPVSVPPAPTLADGIAVRRVGAQTLPVVQRYVDEIVTVEEEELAGAVLFLLERQKTMAEGSGAAAVAALLHGHVAAAASGTTVAVVSGGNIDVNVLARIIERGLVKDGRLLRLRVRIGDHPGDLHRLLGVVADVRANVMDIEHNRAFTKVALDETVVDLTLETRGPEHVQELEAALGRERYEFQRL
jgi:threonine dehydratase